MKRSLEIGLPLAWMILTLILVSSSPAAVDRFTGGPSGPTFNSWPPDTDAWGYTWTDSDHDTSLHYRWIDITEVGTEIQNLADDNGFGPFLMGFDFAYYWMTSNVFYLGSNGYISLTDDIIQAATFPDLPNPARPNGTIAPMMSDLIFPADSARAYYWINPATDTCIMSYVNVPFWDRNLGWSGLSTFQIILSQPDSGITFQYKYHDKGSYDYGGEGLVVGIEDPGGHWGLSYLYATSAAMDSLHTELAIKFRNVAVQHPPVYDLSRIEAMTPGSRGFFVNRQDTVTVWGKVKNVGNQPVPSYRVYGKVEMNREGLGWVLVYRDSLDVTTGINPGEIDSVALPHPWLAIGQVSTEFRIAVSCTTASDSFPGNNGSSIQDFVECHIVDIGVLWSGRVGHSLPDTLSYDDTGTASPGSILYGAQTGLANKYTPPFYPVYIYSFGNELAGYTGDVVFHLWDDDGLGGTPGTILFEDTVSMSGAGWYDVVLDPFAYRIDSGSIYVGIWVISESGPAMMTDLNPPFSRQGWELLGGGASAFRYMFSSDLSNRIVVGPAPAYIFPRR